MRKLVCHYAAVLILANGIALSASPLAPEAECEETVYSYEPANNGAGPLWCHGSTCLVRTGDEVFASGLRTLPGAKPLNNCEWILYTRTATGWEIIPAGNTGRTREPSPLAVTGDGRVFLSANPTLNNDPEAYAGPARPEIYEFPPEARTAFKRLLPEWDGSPIFTEHSYRSFAADRDSNELILLQNIGYTHAEWTFFDRTGHWPAQGQLKWPVEAGKPIRICYPNVALKERAVHFCGTSDIVEPNSEWRAFKKELTGQEWDYTFRRLFYTWTPDVTQTEFHDWIELANVDSTAGGITLGDLWLSPNGAVYLLWTERAIDERLREKFFPDAKQRHSLVCAVLRDGKIVSRRVLLEAVEGGATEVPGRARFQVTPENRLFAVFYVGGRNREGDRVSENRIVEIAPDGTPGAAVRLPLKHPMSDFFTATVRAGSPPSRSLEMLGQRVGSHNTISYARVRLY